MSIKNFIPTVWSENLLTALDQRYSGVAHCTRDYEGEIKNKGSVVKICGVGDITVADYTKDTDMSTPQALSDTVKELVIEQAKYFNFQIDDIDKTQCSPKLMDAAIKVAASALANEADKYVYSVALNTGHSLTYDKNDESYSFLDAIIQGRELLYASGVPDTETIVLEVSPKVATVIFKEKLALPYCDYSAAEAGYFGSFAGCKIYVNNNLPHYEGGNPNDEFCLMRTTRAVAFAEQFSEIEAYRPEKRFADAVKGLHLYGAKVLYPNETVTILARL